MARGTVDHGGLASERVRALRDQEPPAGIPFRVTRLGHAVLRVTELERSVGFYTRVLGFRVSDAYPESMMPGGMVFLRWATDHHGLALVGGSPAPSESRELHHLAFELGSLDELVRARDHLKANGVSIDFEGRRRAGCQIAVEFRDPDGHCLELYWGLDQIGTDGRSRDPDQWRAASSIEAAIANPPAGQDTTSFAPRRRRSRPAPRA